jgi:Flp pilus assembly CpaE family ATPase
MTHRNEDDEIIDTALDTLAWQRREIDRLTAEVAQAARAERDRIVAFLNCSGGEIACKLADWIEAGEHLK